MVTRSFVRLCLNGREKTYSLTFLEIKMNRARAGAQTV